MVETRELGAKAEPMGHRTEVESRARRLEAEMGFRRGGGRGKLGGNTGAQELGGTSRNAGDSGTLGITSPTQPIKSISIRSSIYSPVTSCNSHSVAGV